MSSRQNDNRQTARLASQMQTCQAAARLTLHRLPFSPWANQTELWEGRPRLWCLCRRGNSAWQLLAFRQQPVFMEIIPPYSRCSRLLLITAQMKTKLSFLFFIFFPHIFQCGRPRRSKVALIFFNNIQCFVLGFAEVLANINFGS